MPVETDDYLHVYQRELDYLIGSLRRLAVPHADTEDLLHEVFLVMVARWDDYDRKRPVRPWLFGIAFRIAATHRRKTAREVASGECDNMPGEQIGPDDALSERQGRALLLRALAEVPIERRAVLIMREVDELSMREIAEHLAIPMFTGYSRLRKARQELDAALLRLQKTSKR